MPQTERWKALQNYDMLAAQKYVENVYYHELARALRGFGYTVVNSARGDFEIAEVPTALRERFSKRHAQIDGQTNAFLAEHPEMHGANVQAIREHLARKERDRKLRGISTEQLRGYWSGQLSDAEREVLHPPTSTRDTPHQEQSTVEALDWAEGHLFERRSVVREHELWRHALASARGSDLTVDELKRETEARGYLRAEHDKVSRRDVLAREWAIVETARDGVGRHSPLATLQQFDGSELAPDQLRAFRQILESTDFITLFRGGAGTGKSFVLRRVQDALRRAGHVTKTSAPQRQQVIDLGRDGLEDVQTVAELIQRGALPESAVVIVDEAGQIGGQQMLDLLRLVKEANGRLILSGDTRQHGPVEASDALRAIERYSGLCPAQLDEIRRQDPARASKAEERERIAVYRKAVEAASAGDLVASLGHLEKLGAVKECGVGEQRERLTEAYVSIAAQGESAIVVSQTSAEVREINEAVRERLRERGALNGAETSVIALEQIDLTAAQKADARHYPAESCIVFNREFRGCAARGKRIARRRYACGNRRGGKRQDRAGPAEVHRSAYGLPPGATLALFGRKTSTQSERRRRMRREARQWRDRYGFASFAGWLDPTWRMDARCPQATGSFNAATLSHLTAPRARLWITSSSPMQGCALPLTRSSGMSPFRAGGRASKSSPAIESNSASPLREAATVSWRSTSPTPLADPYDSARRSCRTIHRGHEFARRLCRAAMRAWVAAFVKPETQHVNETPSRKQQQSVRANVLAT